MNNRNLDLSVVVPLYNEAENLLFFYERLKNALTSDSYEIIFVDDGSDDQSYALIQNLCRKDLRVRGISLSRNFGHQIALTAGLDHAKGDAVIMMDADLQHPPELLPQLIEKFQEGYDIVLTKRIDEGSIKFFKKATSWFFYKFINFLSDTAIELASADFRLMSRKTVEAFKTFREHSRFNRGLISWMGFSHTTIPYTADPRYKGRSKYTLPKMIRLAVEGLTAFSSKPLRLSFYLGVFISFISMIYAAYAISTYLHHRAISGWTSLLVSILFLGGIQLISIGILGEYQARIFDEVKNRPLYLVKSDTVETTS